MPPYKEEDVQGAIDAVLHGQSVQGASCDWGIPRTTFMGRIQGLKPRRSSHQLQQILSESQEIQLANWILCQSNMGYAPSHTTVRSMVTKLLRLNGLNRTPGKNWMNRFLACHPEIYTIKGVRIDNQCINRASPEVIRMFFELFDAPTIKDIPPQHRYNMDETRIMEGLGVNGLVLGSSERKRIYVKSSVSRHWTTILECISTTSQYIKPLVIFKGKNVQAQWYPERLEEYEGWAFTYSENGWTSNSTAVEWIKDIFKPQTRPQNSDDSTLPESQTPKKPTHELEKVADIDIFTPSHGYQITELVWQIQKHLENSNYITRLLLRKVNKALDDKNMVLALKNRRIEELELQLEAIRPSKRLRVPENPNSKFVKIPEIMKAKEELEAKIASWKAKNPELMAVTTSKLVESIPMEQLMFEFQLE
ncbi:hypothetical protein B7463_g9036, partial [Scytalidium lignicola]